MYSEENQAGNSLLLRFEDVSLAYGRRVVLQNLNFSLHRGDYVGLVGPNGAGKTTLLRALLGTVKPHSGAIHSPRSVHWGYVPQVQTMDEHFPFSVLDVALMGRYRQCGLLRRPSAQDRAIAMRALEDVGIADLHSRTFRELSGGQRQRALMARALASQPDALALDEPTNDMDISAERATMELLDRLHSEHGLLVLMASHLLNVVVNHVQEVALIGRGTLALGAVDDMIHSERLKALYGVDVTVAHLGDRRLVV
ncbi:MAG: metal ABC transporter ATP-binding protein [Armatimonadetes bacterium]|nr:metal ABC transporter ATP-binding protein [Armatimonadota bacterium]